MVTDHRFNLAASSMSPPPSSSSAAVVGAMASTSSSPARQRSRPSSNNSSSGPFHLGNLPRFHPAVYQPPTTTTTSQPPSPVQYHQPQQRPSSQPYRVQTSSGSGSSTSRDSLRQYHRDLMVGVPLAFATTSPTSSSANYTRPAKPRLDPMRSPGPVTPLALEEDEDDGYLGMPRSSDGSSETGNDSAAAAAIGRGPTPDLVEHLIQRENERFAAQSRLRKDNKGR